MVAKVHRLCVKVELKSKQNMSETKHFQPRPEKPLNQAGALKAEVNSYKLAVGSLVGVDALPTGKGREP